MARPPITAKGELLFRRQLEAALDYVESLGGGGGSATDLGYVAATRLLTSSTGADVTLPLAGSDPGLMAAADKTKLDGLSNTARGVATVTVPNNSREWRQTVTATGVVPSNVVILSVAPHLDADENDAELLDVMAASALAGTDQITVVLSFDTPTAGPIKLNWMAA